MTDKTQAVERLVNQKYFNPYDAMQLTGDATDTDIKKQYRALSMLVHPDKNPHPEAAAAFNVLDSAYKQLQDVEKRQTFQRVMREAVELVTLDRQKENQTRQALGKKPLPEDTKHLQVQDMCRKLFQEIEDKK